jgi:DNA-binding MarR family transcriptional regulator
VYRYREQRCPHGFVDNGRSLCTECEGAPKAPRIALLIDSIPGATTNVRDLMRSTGMPRPSVELALKGLVTKQLVLRGCNTISLTPEGWAAVAALAVEQQ